MIVNPIARPGDRGERAARVGGAGEDDPDEEEGQDPLDDRTLRRADAVAERRDAERDRIGDRVRQEPRDRERGHDRAGELGDPVEDRVARREPARDQEPERHGRVEVPARDVPDGGDHDGDREAVREGDGDEVAARGGGDRPDADEDQRERADELGGRALQTVSLHAAQGRTRAGRLLEGAVGEQAPELRVLAEPPDGDERVALLDHVVGLRARDRLRLAEDGDDRDPRPGAEPHSASVLPIDGLVSGTATHSIASSPIAISSSSTIFGRS